HAGDGAASPRVWTNGTRAEPPGPPVTRSQASSPACAKYEPSSCEKEHITMTDLDLAAIRQRYLAAAPGPWELGDTMHEGETCHDWTIHSPADGYPVAGTAWLLDRLSRDQHLATADFIAHAR